MSIPGSRPFVLATVHFPAIQQDQGDKQREVAVALRHDVEVAEGRLPAGEPLSILIGDFNANPFDPGITAVYGLNATHLKEIAERSTRNANGREHRYFYNPMWRFLGVEPWGTYFNDQLSNPVRFDWFMLDQVLVRPEFIRYFDRRDQPDLVIPLSDDVVDLNPFLRRKQKESDPYPDHLPLYFRFDLPRTIVSNQEDTNE